MKTVFVYNLSVTTVATMVVVMILNHYHQINDAGKIGILLASAILGAYRGKKDLPNGDGIPVAVIASVVGAGIALLFA